MNLCMVMPHIVYLYHPSTIVYNIIFSQDVYPGLTIFTPHMQGGSIENERSYETFASMAEKESSREDGIDVVAIVTTNHLHYPIAESFLTKGIHVICDKPMTSTMKDAHALVKAVSDSKAHFFLGSLYEQLNDF